MKEKIYLVGVYDEDDKEYIVMGVYSTKSKAKRIAAEIPNSQIDEYSLDEGFDELEAGLKPWRLTVFDDGKVISAREKSLDEILGTNGEICWVPRHPAIPTDGFWQMVWARDKSHAQELSEVLLKKVLNEKESRKHE